MWHMTAPALAERFHVICPDIRGYGGSFKPGPSADHAAYPKREMAGDMVRLMAHFGYQEFAVVGHDRGGRVAHRLALDHAEKVTRRALEDYMHWVRQPETIIGMCEDYRAAATIDLVHDRASRAAGDKVRCPMLVLWGDQGKIEAWYDALAVWREYCSAPVTGHSVPSGHYLPEEAPDAVIRTLMDFLGR